jgi:hypothetical protein
LENLGIVLQAAGRSAEAVGLLEDALAVLRPAVGEDHSLVYDATVWLDSARAALPAAIGPGQAIR